MRVKITYTVELDEVEQEVSEIMSRASNDLDFCYQEITRLQLDLDTKTGNIEDHASMLDKIRIKMAKADQVLDDCQSIITGLIKTRKQLEEQENEIQDGWSSSCTNRII